MKSLIRKIRRPAKSFGRGQKGFTLIEVLVVVAILGVLAAVAVPSVASFIGTGDDTAAEVELRDVQTAVTAMMAADSVGTVAAVAVATADISSFVAVTSNAADYMTGLTAAGLVTSGHTYTMAADGVVTQVS